MSFLSFVRRWWKRPGPAARKPRRSALQFDVLESRELLSAVVSISAPAFNVNSVPKVIVTATDANPMVEVAIDVDLDGNKSFAGPGDMGQTVENISLVSGQATTITLNTFPQPYLSSYVVRARVLDSTGAWGTSSVVAMAGPAADLVSVTAPVTLSPTSDNATIQVTAGTNDALPSTATLFVASSTGTIYQEFAQVSLSSTGKATVPLIGLRTGSYKLRAQIEDPAGNTDLSATPITTAPAPTVSITAMPFAVGQTPQVIVTANSINPVVQVAIDVGLDGSSTFTNPSDLNQTVDTVTLVNGQATVINLNALPEPYRSSYYVRARVLDAAGNTATSSVVSMRGPQPNTVSFSAPTTVTATNATATILVTAGVGNSLTSTAYVDYAPATSTTFTQFASLPLTSGKALFNLLSLPSGTYHLRARTVDASGNTDVSTTLTVTIPAPTVTVSAPVFTVTSVPQVTVTANGINPIVEVAIDVSLSGSSTFSGPNDMNQTVDTIRLTNGVATPIVLNALPMPYLSSYYVRARVLDSQGNWGTSSVIIMQGPHPDTVTLSVPSTITASSNTATVHVTAGLYNALPSSAYVDLDISNTGAFTQFASAPLSSTGTVTMPLVDMPAGSYHIRAAVDPAGDTDVSTSLTIYVPPPAVSITALPFVIGTTPQVMVTASDLNAMTQISFDVALDGSSTFSGEGDLNQTVQSVTLVNGQTTIISLNAFPTPYRSSYLIRAHVTDSAGNVGTSSVVTMQGPAPDTVLLTVPSGPLSATANNVNVQVLSGLNNQLPSAVALYVDLNKDGIFEPNEQFAVASLNSEGFASIPLQYQQLLPGTYSIQAQVLDPADDTDVSSTHTISIASPAASNAQPITFIPNVGQVTYDPGVTNQPNVEFVAPIGSGTAFLSPNELDLNLGTVTSGDETVEQMQTMDLVGASPSVQGVGEQLEASTTNYFVNGLSTTGVANYGEVSFPGVYPDINLTYLGGGGTLQYTFTVEPGASPSSIVMSFPNATAALDGAGDLVLTLSSGNSVTYTRPVAYQVAANGVQEAVLSSFAINNGQVSISVGSYNPTLPLIIDPYIFTNFLSGSATVASTGGMAVDSQGDVYSIANTAANNFGNAGGVSTGSTDTVVTKVNASGQLVYATYIGASGVNTAGHALAIDSTGYVYITGTTVVPTAPTVFPGIPATAFSEADFGLAAGNTTGFVTILNSTGNIFQSTFLGNSLAAGQGPIAIALDGFGDIYVAGNATTFNVPAPFRADVHMLTNFASTFLTEFTPRNVTTTGFQYTDLIGGAYVTPPATATASSDSVLGMYIDSENRIYLVGNTNSTNDGNPLTVAEPWGQKAAITLPAAYQQSKPYITTNPVANVATGVGDTTGYVLQLQEDTLPTQRYAILTYSTFIGGSGTTNVSGIYVKSQNAPNQATAFLYLTGTTNSADNGLGTPADFFQQVTQGFSHVNAGGDTKAYILELEITANPTAATNTTQVTGTFIGNAGQNEVGDSIAVDSSGNIYVDGSVPTGETSSAFFDTNPVQPFPAAASFTDNTFLVEFNPTATSIILGTLIGGNTAGEIDQSSGVVGVNNVGCVSLGVTPTGTTYIVGLTNNYTSFQAVVTANSGTSTVSPNPGFAGGNSEFITKIGKVNAQNTGSDQFEPNDTSNIAANLGSPSGTNGLGELIYGPFPNLNTFRHDDGLFDYDWYQIVPPSTKASWTMTVTISNIAVVYAGAIPEATSTGDLDLYVYRMINGFLYLLGSSTLVNSPTQSVTVSVPAGADILFEVNPYNYTQATYTMQVTLT